MKIFYKLKNLVGRIKNPWLRAICFVITLGFCFGGVVNLGLSGITFSIPFFIALGLMSRSWEKSYKFVSLFCIVGIFLPFYFMRKTNSDIFYPANGKTIILTQDACHSAYGPFSPLAPISDCHDPQKILLKGTKFKIEQTKISYADLSYNFYIEIKTSFGPRDYFIHDGIEPSYFSYESGKPVTEESLHHFWIEYPADLMCWPLILFLVPNEIITALDKTFRLHQ